MILFLNASPRKRGYTTQIMKLIEKSIDSHHTVEWVSVNDLQIKPCISCFKCRPDGECVLPPDDGHRVTRLIRNADALVMGSPTYFGNITGPLRTLIDRALTGFESIAASGLELPVPLHRGKKAAIVTACNSPSPYSQRSDQAAGAVAAMQTTLNAGGYDTVGVIVLDGAAALTAVPEDIDAAAVRIANLLSR